MPLLAHGQFTPEFFSKMKKERPAYRAQKLQSAGQGRAQARLPVKKGYAGRGGAYHRLLTRLTEARPFTHPSSHPSSSHPPLHTRPTRQARATRTPVFVAVGKLY